MYKGKYSLGVHEMAVCGFKEQSYQFRFLGNCPPIPPLSHHFAQSKK